MLDSSGGVLERMSFDAWGKRRQLDWTHYVGDPALIGSPNTYTWQGQQITRGYTGHEQLDAIGLVHMNGRVYDADIGRFLSPDIVIQDMTNLQSVNAYSYVLNNPLSMTDPSGFFFRSLFRAIGNAFRAVFRAIGSAFRAVVRSQIFRSLIQIGVCAVDPVFSCAAAAAALTAAAGGSVLDALKAGLMSFAQAHIWPAVHVLGEALQTAGTLAHSAVHGVVSGALSVAQGGTFMQGFVSGAVAQTTGLVSEGAFGSAGTGSFDMVAARTAAAAVGGGVGAEITGGKFANGAVTGAFAHMWNAENIFEPNQALGDGYTSRIDRFNYKGESSFEIHVFDKASKEVGVYGPDGWIMKHGFKEAPNLPSAVDNAIRGIVVDELRSVGLLPAKGRANIKGVPTSGLSKFLRAAPVVGVAVGVATEGPVGPLCGILLGCDPAH